VITLLFLLKIRYPFNIVLLRGNHECPEINHEYGFFDECTTHYDKTVWAAFNRCFQWLPLSAIVNDKILCVHGGLSPDLKTLDQLKVIDREKLLTIPNEGIECDLVWSDPERNETSWGENDRGCSYVFGANVVNEFCANNNLDLVCRAHQVVDEGYEFFCSRKLVTVFTASNYCGDYGNNGCVLVVDDDMTCRFIILKSRTQTEVVLELKTGQVGGETSIRNAKSDGGGRPLSPVYRPRCPSPPP
jgi:serine/threonine-protein phosphatase PP1 catalytic subunit